MYIYIYEHKRDIRLGNLKTLFLYISKTDSNFDFKAAMMLAHILNKRQICEARAI